MLHKQIVPQDIVTGFTCDRCGKSVNAENIDIEQSIVYHEALHINFVGGYSSIFGDGIKVECDLCQECLYDLIKDICRTSMDL